MWLPHDRLAIEDPFETYYDVAHVIKQTQMKYIHKEFLRAYTLIARSMNEPQNSNNNIENDELLSNINTNELLQELCQKADLPIFSHEYKEARKRFDSIDKILEDED